MYVCMYVCIGNSRYSIHQTPLHTLNYIFLSKAFLLRTYYQFRISQSAKIQLKNRYFEEQICWVPLTVGTFRMSNSLPTCASLGLMPVGSSPPILGQTIDRCISTPINGLPRMVEGGGGGWGGPTRTGGQMMLTCLFYLCLLY